MKFYRAFNCAQDMPDYHYFVGKAFAHDDAKQLPRAFARIEEVDVPSDQEGLQALLNGDGGKVIEVKRTWALTPRGGLKEVPNGE